MPSTIDSSDNGVLSFSRRSPFESLNSHLSISIGRVAQACLAFLPFVGRWKAMIPPHRYRPGRFPPRVPHPSNGEGWATRPGSSAGGVVPEGENGRGSWGGRGKIL